MKQRLKGSAVALMVAAGAVGGLTANIAAVPDAQAFGLGDVWGAAKKVGGVAKIGTGLVADSVDLAVEAKHGARKLTGEIVKGAGTVIKNTAQQANKALGINAKLDPRFKEGLRHIGGAARHVGSDIMTNVRRVENAKKRSARCVLTFERCIEFKPKGSAANSPVQPRPGWDRPVGSTGKKRVQATKVRSTVGWAVPQVGKPSAARAPVKGITRQDLGLKKSGRRPLGRDKSIWGRPVGQKPLKHGRGRQPLGNGQVHLGSPGWRQAAERQACPWQAARQRQIDLGSTRRHQEEGRPRQSASTHGPGHYAG